VRVHHEGAAAVADRVIWQGSFGRVHRVRGPSSLRKNAEPDDVMMLSLGARVGSLSDSAGAES